MRLILLGAPGVGKGTQGALLAERFGIERVSTGDLLRDAVRRGTPLGRNAKRYMAAGELVPDPLILDLVREVLSTADSGFVLDGFPRTIPQAEGLDELLGELSIALDAVMVLEAPDEVLIKRISGRRSCPRCGAVYNIHFEPPAAPEVCDRCGTELVQRADDDADTVVRRLEVYHAQTRPLVDYYERTGRPVRQVDGGQPVDTVQDSISAVLAA